MLKRVKLSVGRWVSVACCGLVAATVFWFFDGLIGRLGGPVIDRLSAVHPIATLLGIVGIPSAACCWFAGRKRWGGFIGLRRLLGYPPLWVAVVFGLAGWSGLLVLSSSGRVLVDHVHGLAWFVAQVPLWAWTVPATVVVAVVVVRLLPEVRSRIRRRGRPGLKETLDKTELLASFEKLRQWLADDSEVRSPDQDLFGHDAIARRMAERLVQPGAPTMAVIGPLGSGKSTVRQLVQFHLRDQPNVCLVPLSLWPFDSSEAAVRGILGALVKCVASNVNVLPLVGLSDDYVMAIEKSAGMYGGIARLLRGSSDPSGIVESLSNIASAAGFRIVLWVEDLERFSGKDSIDDSLRAAREVERLSPIRALLYLLDRCPAIAVVASDANLRTRFDIEKIVRIVEDVPPMKEADVWKAVELLRTACLSGYPKAVIDAAHPSVRRQWRSQAQQQPLGAWLSAFINSDASVLTGIVHVLKTPRMLKAALRIALETWEAIPGEVDLDAVLVASVLRTARPGVFAILSERNNIIVLQQGMKNPFTPLGREQTPHPVVDRIDQALAGEDPVVASSIRSLISYIFPKYQGNDSNDEEFVQRPQGLFVNRHTDYWRRYMAQAPVMVSESDQALLESIRAWRIGEMSDLIERTVDPERAGQVESFVGHFKSNELCRLLNEVADRLSGESASGWPDGSHAPGVSSVWRMMLNSHPPESDVFETVRKVVDRVVPIHLPLAHNIVYFFAGGSGVVQRLMSESDGEKVWDLLVGALTRDFLGAGADDRLAVAARNGAAWVVWWIASGMGRVKKGALSGLPFGGWPQFADVLLALAECQPDVGIPLIVPFVTRSNLADRDTITEDGKWKPGFEWIAEFDENSARQLFNFSRLICVLARWNPPVSAQGQTRSHFEAAVGAARRVLALSSPGSARSDSD